MIDKIPCVEDSANMLLALIKTMRPKQWTKNVFLLPALIFDRKLFNLHFAGRTLAAFVIFCAISSAVYLINDLADIEKDRQHPVKRNRPLASGQLSPRVAVIAAVALIVVSLPLALLLDRWFAAIAATYVVMMLAYSLFLKNIVIVDVFAVAAGHVLRVAAGVAVVQVERFSPWIYLCMVLAALFIAISKRRHELVLLDKNANAHRAILDEYSLPLLDDMTRLVVACTAMAYSLYTFSAPNLPTNHAMMLTIPFVLYGLFRYLYLIHIKRQGGAPEDLLFQDKPLLLDIVLWGVTVVFLLYFTH